LVIARQATLETEIRNVITEGEEDKIFIRTAEGIWFGGVNKNRNGNLPSFP
jgi:hypothetical protein